MSSYATREEADTFLSSLLGMNSWDKADDAEKERALATATMHLDALEASVPAKFLELNRKAFHLGRVE